MKKKKIDLAARKTEAGWQRSTDAFFLAATMRWFQWVEWLLMLGALTFVAEKSDSLAVKVVTIISYVMLGLYFQSYFYQFEFVNIPYLKRNPRLSRAISIGISAVLGLVVFFLLRFSISSLKGTGPN